MASASSASPNSEQFAVAVVDVVAVEGRFRRVADLLKELVPTADVQHVGSTALPGTLSKGDLDVQVRVTRAEFDAAVNAIGSTFQRSTGAYLPPDGQSFEDVGGDIPVGIHLTVKGSDSDEQWIFREVLKKDADLRAIYDGLKRSFDGRPMAEYRREKAAFFERLKNDVRFVRERALEGFPSRFTTPVQWGELDANNHVNNVSFMRWFESARGVFLYDVSFFSSTGIGPILASASCRYKAPLHYPDVITAAVRARDVKADRFTLELALYSDKLQRLAAVGDAVVVAYDYAQQTKAELPADVRAKILART